MKHEQDYPKSVKKNIQVDVKAAYGEVNKELRSFFFSNKGKYFNT